jgi:N-methylhydantoinase B|tara:strand:- start:3672 stop:5228 length:1557 start_codon:yes stop_codon:yes gene_type:complete
LDPIQLEICWSNLIALVSEQAKSLQRNAFSPIVREAGDLGTALFDAQGRTIAQAVTGTPGHINSLAATAKTLVTRFPPETICDGDIFIVNDPWLAAGHFFDITVITPVFYRAQLIAFLGTTVHHTDIGGYGLGAGARDIHEEGLWIPLCKLYDKGRPNDLLFDIIRHNVRTPEAVSGDLSAQISAGHLCGQRLITLCERHKMDNIQELADAIISRSEVATRNTIRALPAGTYHGATVFDIPGGETITLKAAVTVDSDNGEILIDFSGSSAASSQGINVVLNYTHAYSTFAVRASINPELPNNHGSLAPIKVTAPEGCIVNARYPSPLNARHIVGMFVPFPILNALFEVTPDSVVSEGAGGLWTMQIQGFDEYDAPFTSTLFNYSGGMGARREKNGPSTTCYPSGLSAVPIEVLEASMPILFDHKEIWANSGGNGRYRGGDGQRIQFRLLTEKPWVLNAMCSRVDQSAQGLDGGLPGAVGRFLVSGNPTGVTKKIEMKPDDIVTMYTPGGGGFGSPVAK